MNSFWDFFWLLVWTFFFVMYLIILFQIIGDYSETRISAVGGRRSGSFS